MEMSALENIKRLAIVAMFSDDEFMKRLVLKGGNAMDLVLRVSPRASLDIDLSMADDFRKEELPSIGPRLKDLLTRTFAPEGYQLFDYQFVQRPEEDYENKPAFWGGYEITFKLIDSGTCSRFRNDLTQLRLRALPLGIRDKKPLRIEISKFECCDGKTKTLMDGYTIYVYTPTMLVVEKLRAICQQMRKYAESVPSPSRSARARDFFDICVLMENYSIDLASTVNRALLRRVFAAKQVPIHLIGHIRDTREFHRPDFASVRDTLKPGQRLEGFDFYFDYVVEKCRALEALWEV